MKLTRDRLKNIIKEELENMQEVDVEEPTFESIKKELYELHTQLSNDGVKFEYGKVIQPTVVAACLQRHAKTALNIMKKLKDFATTRDAHAINEKGGDDEAPPDTYKPDDPHADIRDDEREYRAIVAQAAKQRKADEEKAAKYYARQAREKAQRDAARAARAAKTE